MKSRHIRFFISSTFQDMQAERDCLMKYVFPELRRIAAERNVVLTEVDLRWGITEEESQSKEVLDVCLQEIDNSIPFFIGILGYRYGWCPTKEDLSPRSLECYNDLHRYVEHGISATEIEIQYGVLERKEKINAYFYIKDADDCDIAHVDNIEKLSALKKAIINQERYPVSYYKSIEMFGDRVKDDFISLLDELYPIYDMTLYTKQELYQEFVLNKLCKAYVPVLSYNNMLNDWLERNSDSLMIVYGESGLGKSAFLANWIMKQKNNFELFYYFINNYLESESLFGILGFISESLIKRYQLEETISVENSISNPFLNFSDILDEIKRKSISKPIIIIDGINQLGKNEFSKLMGVLCSFTSKARFVVSAIDLCITSDLKMFSNIEYIEICPLNENQKTELISSYLALHGRKLDNRLIIRIIKDSQCNNTLILKSLLDELMTFGIFNDLDAIIDYYLSPTSGSFYNCFLSRLENDYGFNITRDVLCLILLSKAGLSEEELKDVLKLRNLEFSQFVLAFGNQLINKNGYLVPSHQRIVEEVKNRYLQKTESILAYREKLIEYFKNFNHTRAIEEMAWQLYITGQYVRLHSFLMSYANAAIFLANDPISFALYWKPLLRDGYLFQDYLECKECTADDIFMKYLAGVLIDYFNDYETADKLYTRIHNNLNNRQSEFMDFLENTFKDLIDNGSIYLESNIYNPGDLCNQAEILVSQRKYQEALNLYNQAYQLILDRQYTHQDQEEMLKSDEIEVLIKIADVKDYLGDREGSENEYKSTYYLLQRLKKQYPTSMRLLDLEIDLLVNLSTVLETSDDKFYYLNKALRLQQQYLGFNNHRMAIIMMNIGAVYNDMLGLNLKAQKYYKQALKIQTLLTGEDNIAVANIYYNLCCSASNFEEASLYYEKAKNIYKLLDYPLGLAKLYNCYAIINENNALYDSAFIFYAESLMLREEYLGIDHPLTQETLSNLNDVGSILGKLGFINSDTLQPNVATLNVVDIMIKAAENGFSAAQYNLGYWYYYGDDIPQDIPKGIELLKQSWVQGNVEAARLLMQIYYNGTDVEKDDSAAFNYIFPAAEKGDCQSQYYVGMFYSNGLGVDSDIDEAIKWYTKSAEQGFVEAYNDLAWNLYLKNDFQDALKWAILAVDEMPEDYNVSDTIAHIYQSLGLFELSLKHFNKCKELKLKYNESEESISETESKIKGLNDFLCY